MSGTIPVNFAASVIGRTWLNDETFTLSCTRPENFSFAAGQHVALVVGGEERDYTLISQPTDTELRFLVKQVVGGKLSSTLAQLSPGAPLLVGPPKGYLVYRPSSYPAVFVATGVGVAPYVAMAAAGVTGFTMIHGARKPSGLFFRQTLSDAASRYIPCLTGVSPEEAAADDAYCGRVTSYVEHNLPAGAYDFYLCGSRDMIRNMTHLLDRIFPEARIYSEAYT